MKKLVLIFAVLVMLCGATASAMKWLKIGPFEEKGVIQAKVIDKRVDDALYVELDPLAIPIFQGNKVAATVQFQIKLETSGKDNMVKIKRIMPVITDAFIRDLHSFLPRLLKAEERLDVPIITQRLQMISDKVGGKGLIKSVDVQSVIDQRR